MADFTSAFWNWFIVILVLASMVGMFWLNYWMTERRRPRERAKLVGHVWDQDLQELNNPLPAWWLNLFYITLVFGIIYLLLFPGLGSFSGALGWSSAKRYDNEVQAADERYGPLYEKYFREHIETLARDRDALKTGERLFVNYCTTCHGSDARGAPGFPDLRDGEWLYGGQPEQIKASILNGRNGVMPPWGAALSRDDIFNLAEYVLSLSGRRINEDAARAGAVKFKQVCAACHGADGKGNQTLDRKSTRLNSSHSSVSRMPSSA